LWTDGTRKGTTWEKKISGIQKEAVDRCQEKPCAHRSRGSTLSQQRKKNEKFEKIAAEKKKRGGVRRSENGWEKKERHDRSTSSTSLKILALALKKNHKRGGFKRE